MKAVVIGVKENKAAVLMHDGSMRYVENKGYEKGTILELPDTDDAVTGFEAAKKKRIVHFPQRFMYSAAASLVVLTLSGAMVSFACPVSTIPLSSDPEVTLGVNVYGRVIEINAGNNENEELLKEIKRELKGRPVPEVSQAIELKFDEHRKKDQIPGSAGNPGDSNMAEPGSAGNPGDSNMAEPGSKDTEPQAPEIQHDQPSQGGEGDPDIEPPAPEKQESTGDQRPENPGSRDMDNPAPENSNGRDMANPGSEDTDLPAPEIQHDKQNQDGFNIKPPAPESKQDQPGQGGEDTLGTEPPAPVTEQDQPGQDAFDMEPPAPPEDRESPPETESGGHSEKSDDGPKEDHGPGPGDHGDGGHGGPGGGP